MTEPQHRRKFLLRHPCVVFDRHLQQWVRYTGGGVKEKIGAVKTS